MSRTELKLIILATFFAEVFWRKDTSGIANVNLEMLEWVFTKIVGNYNIQPPESRAYSFGIALYY